MNRRHFLTAGMGGLVLTIGGFQAEQILLTTKKRLQNNQQMNISPTTTSPSDSIVTVQISERIRVHALRSGWVQVRPPHREFSSIEALRFPAILLSSAWTEKMPVWMWLIEHPDGFFLVDTGENTHVHEPDYFGEAKGDGWVNRRILQLDIPEQEQLSHHLETLGIPEHRINAVVLTHGHLDHTDGLRFLPTPEIFIAKTEWEQPFGVAKTTFPKWLKPRFISHDATTPLGDLSSRDNPFGAAHRLASGLYTIPTPGHTAGHQSVLLIENDVVYCFAGDTSFTEHQLLANAVAGICISPDAARETYARFKTLAARVPLVYLPSHDPEAALRLSLRQTLHI